ncbi:phospholipase A2-like [Prorops nasuta]|uniref:phospholipase A2-like n=1 Tax=Prorops nasuta TaxID=863751 RepID=UPI0034CF901B
MDAERHEKLSSNSWYELKYFVIVLIYCKLASQKPPTNLVKRIKNIWSCRTKSNHIREVFYHEQTVVVADLGPDRKLHYCNILEVYETQEADELLEKLKSEHTTERMSLEEMIKLTHQCELLEKFQTDYSVIPSSFKGKEVTLKKQTSKTSLDSLSSATIGTKWCGPENKADHYHDLGQNVNIDRCCRRHDLCPVKIRPNDTKYNLTNTGEYTKYHCLCEEEFHTCLRFFDDPAGNIIGRTYFSYYPINCIDDIPDEQYPYITIRKFIRTERHTSMANEWN